VDVGFQQLDVIPGEIYIVEESSMLHGIFPSPKDPKKGSKLPDQKLSSSRLTNTLKQFRDQSISVREKSSPTGLF
jgi:hypothetical protein